MTPVPVEADNYQGVVAVKGHLLYVKADAPFYGRDPRAKPTLVIYSIKDRKESTLAEGVDAWAVSRDGSKVLVRVDDALQLLDAKPDAKEKKTVSTKGLMVDRVPAQEWAEIFDEVWRRYRDFFYVPNMHGYDWKAIGERYRALLPHVAHRSDLNYVLGEMVAELNVGHAYIEGGDYEIPARPKVALPGRASSSTRRPGATASPASSRARTRRSRTARRSPRSAWTRRWATTSSRSTASSSGPTTTRTGCCGTRPTPSR